MDTKTHVFSMQNVYWKYSRKWFLGIIAGMASLEIGLLLFYLSGGIRYMYYTASKQFIWPLEYKGALQSIRLDVILLILVIVFAVLLTLSFLSVNTKKTILLVRRLPLDRRDQMISQVVHTATLVLILWLSQFLLLVLGFFIYRAFSPANLSIDVQLYEVFQDRGFVRSFFPFFDVASWPHCVLALLNLSLLPCFFVDQIQTREAGVTPMVVTFLVPLGIAYLVDILFGSNFEWLGRITFLCLFALGMILRLFVQKYSQDYRSVEE